MVRNVCNNTRKLIHFHNIDRVKYKPGAMATIFGIDHKYFAVGSVAASVGVAIYATYRLSRRAPAASPSDYYETRKLVNEYLLFHYGKFKEVLSYEDFAPTDSTDFPQRCADLCLNHYKPRVSRCSESSDVP